MLSGAHGELDEMVGATRLIGRLVTSLTLQCARESPHPLSGHRAFEV